MPPITKNLGQIASIILSDVAPSNTNVIWGDTSNTDIVFKAYQASTSSWVPFSNSATVNEYESIADGAATAFTFTHNLNIPSAKYSCDFDVYNTGTSIGLKDFANISSISKTANSVTVTFSVAPLVSRVVRIFVVY